MRVIYKKTRALWLLVKHLSRFCYGYLSLVRTGTTPVDSYRSMRYLYVMTNGRFNDAAHYILEKTKPPVALEVSDSIFGDLTPDSLKSVASNIENKGFHIFDNLLASDKVEKIRQFAQKAPSQAIIVGAPVGSVSQERAPFHDHKTIAPKYNIALDDLINCVDIQDLLADKGMLTIAQQVLQCTPVLDLVAMWWSAPCAGRGTKEAAQMYHFDMDRIKFIKFFFYLTDVKSDSGPHSYIIGSSRRKPKHLLRDERITDGELFQYYSRENEVEICGPAGTIVAVDTRGWHKGKPLVKGERLILQVEFANSMFGANYKKVRLPRSCSPKLANAVQSFSQCFGIFNTPGDL